MKTIANIENEDIVLGDDGFVRWRSKAAIDSDGTGPSHGDPDQQNQTSLRINGVSLNADEDRYIVVPPAILQGVKPVVLGCQAYVTYKNTTVTAVVGDIGPHHKLGEISVACARQLGMNWSPTHGGVDEHVVSYVIQPGFPAEVDGKTYPLQPWKP